MKKYFSMILLVASFFGFSAMADITSEAETLSVLNAQEEPTAVMTPEGDLKILSNYLCPKPHRPHPHPHPHPRPRPQDIESKDFVDAMGWGRGPDRQRPTRCYTNGEPCPPGYNENVRYCWNRGWYRCGYQCEDIYSGGGNDGGGSPGGNDSTGGY